MAHAAFNRETSQNGTQYQASKRNGVITFQQTVVRLSLRVADRAAASTKNPVLPDGTRNMAPWSRGGGVNGGVKGLLVRSYRGGDGSFNETIYQGVLASPGPFPGSIPIPNSQGRITAIRKALGNFGEKDVQLGVALQEVRQTTDLVGKYYTAANRGAGKLLAEVQGSKRLRRQFRDFLRHGWKEAPSAYLEYLFGIAPIAGDVQNAVQVLQDTSEKRGAFLLSLRGRFDQSDSFQSTSWYAPDAGPLSNVLADFRVSQSQRAVLRFQLPSWYWDRLPPVTPFRQAYETATLSFVLDWVLPVGDWLSGFEGFQLRPFFRDGCVSTLLRREVSGAKWSAPEWVFVPSGSGGKDYSFTREVLTSFPSTELFSPPRLRTELGLDQLRVGSALLGQKIAALARGVLRP